MGIVVLCVSTMLLLITFLPGSQAKEKREYRKLISKPEHLLEKRVNFEITERPNKLEWRATVFGCTFSNGAALNAVFKDVAYLEKSGYTTTCEYYYDTSDPPSQDVFAELLSAYQEKLIVWQKENQGRPDPKMRPQAPYDFSKITFNLSSPSRADLDLV